jgi:TfoX/Sxy family transcriptional regulator of competence genes
MVKASPELVARFEELVGVVPEADRKLVFGSPTCLVGGNMFFGVHATGLFVKLPDADAKELLGAGGKPFEPMPGRAMGGFFTLPANANHEQWVRRSYDYALTLPPKKAGAKKAARK